MTTTESILTITQYIFTGGIVLAVWMFPAWLARQNGIDGLQMAMVRWYSWFLGWTGIGWLVGLWWAVRK